MPTPRLFHLLHLSHRAVFRAADRILAARHGITAAQQGALMYLAEKEGASMSALAGAVGLKAAATSGLVDRMEQKGLVERRRAAEDGRSFKLYLSPAGYEIVTASRAIIQESNSVLLEGYSPSEQAQMADFLETIIKRADAFNPLENKQELNND